MRFQDSISIAFISGLMLLGGINCHRTPCTTCHIKSYIDRNISEFIKATTPPSKIINMKDETKIYIFELTEFAKEPIPPNGPLPPPRDPSASGDGWSALFAHKDYTAGRPKAVSERIVPIVYLLKVKTSTNGIIQDYLCEKLPPQ